MNRKAAAAAFALVLVVLAGCGSESAPAESRPSMVDEYARGAYRLSLEYPDHALEYGDEAEFIITLSYPEMPAIS